ncbi:MAG: lysophospholipid acyltransferase family protein [bacterium]|nr:lysophospholipid acyltransferase family protein [bacterium]
MFFKFKRSGLESTEGLSGPLLIIANHKFFLDSFAMGAALPINSKILPIRFMGETKHFFNVVLNLLLKIGLIQLVYKIFGVFPVVRGQGLEIALRIPKKIIEDGGVVLMHPEGRVVHEEGVAEFKRGAPALCLTTKARVLPVAFKLCRRDKVWRKRYYVKFGEVFALPEHIVTPEQGAEYMKNIIEKLYATLPAI